MKERDKGELSGLFFGKCLKRASVVNESDNVLIHWKVVVWMGADWGADGADGGDLGGRWGQGKSKGLRSSQDVRPQNYY